MSTTDAKTQRIESLKDTILILKSENFANQKECEKRMTRMRTNTEELTKAWYDRAVTMFVEKHLEVVGTFAEYGEIKRAEDYVRFTIYTLELHGVKNREDCPVVYDAEQEVLRVYRSIKDAHFPE